VLLVHLLEEPVERVLILPFSGDLQHHEKVPKISPGELDGCAVMKMRPGSAASKTPSPAEGDWIPSFRRHPAKLERGELIQEYKVVLHLSGLAKRASLRTSWLETA
jgi:hypothetical protein